MQGVSRIAVTEDVALVTFQSLEAHAPWIARLFQAFAQAELNIDMISQAAGQGNLVSLSFTLPDAQMSKVFEVIQQLRQEHASLCPMISNGNCKIQLYGEQMRTMHGVAFSALQAIADAGAEWSVITTSEVDISLLVPQSHSATALAALRLAFSDALQM